MSSSRWSSILWFSNSLKLLLLDTVGMMIHTAVSCQFFNAIHFWHADLSSLIFSWQKGPASNNFLENILQIVWNFVLVVDIVFPYFTRENIAFWFEIFWNWVHDGIFCGLSLNTVCKYEWHFIFIFVLWNISLGILFRWKLCAYACVWGGRSFHPAVP